MKILITCEHASNKIPVPYRHLFANKEKLLQSHRGWDPGAQVIAKNLARRFGDKLFCGKHSRLLVDLNRSIILFSKFTEVLGPRQRDRVKQKYYDPHWQQVSEWIEKQIAQGERVCHIGIHSFTPVLRGQRRNVDLGLLFDPKRTGELRFCNLWQKQLQKNSSLRIRKNSPYKGTGDGLTQQMRQKFSATKYLGIEVELNQALVRDPKKFQKLRNLLVSCPPFIAGIKTR